MLLLQTGTLAIYIYVWEIKGGNFILNCNPSYMNKTKGGYFWVKMIDELLDIGTMYHGYSC